MTPVAGEYVKAVQRTLGQAKASMTLDTYADLFDEDLDEVAAPGERSDPNSADARLGLSASNALNCENLVQLRGFEPLAFPAEIGCELR